MRDGDGEEVGCDQWNIQKLNQTLVEKVLKRKKFRVFLESDKKFTHSLSIDHFLSNLNIALHRDLVYPSTTIDDHKGKERKNKSAGQKKKTMSMFSWITANVQQFHRR